MATTPELQESQVAAARAKAWHQQGEALLTLEAARTFLETAGLLLFAPRGNALGTPAPSLVEATLGAAMESSTPQQSEIARSLSARLVGEGSAVPLNLLGGAGDLPDFLVSAQAFPFVFTLRGDKGWKRAPEISGAVKVTPLGLRVHELLAEKGALTVAEIVPEIGREVTESAVARALNELWQILRVIPVLQQGEGETRWELLTSRFLKAVKAGANAGQPTALSALVSHFLEQVYVASEEEIAGFLSPLTARSRVREVLHGLIAGQQLAEAVLQGKTLLYLPEALPDFAAFSPDPSEEAKPEEAPGDETSGEPHAGEGAPAEERIRRFQGAGSEKTLRGKSFGRDNAGSRAPGGRGARPGGERGPGERGAERRPFGSRPPRRDDRGPSTGGGGFERRRPSAGRGDFSKPWQDDRAPRPPREAGASESSPRASREGGNSRPTFGDRGPRPPRREGGSREGRPFAPRSAEGRPPRRFENDRPAPRRREDEGSGGSDRPQRPYRERTGEGEGRPPRAGGNRPFRPSGDRPFRSEGDRPFRSENDRPFRSEGDRPYRPKGDRPFRASGDRPARSGEGRPPRPEGGRPSRPAGDRPFRPSGERPFRPASDRPFRSESDRPFRSEGDRPFRPKGDRPFRPSGDRPQRSNGDRPQRPGGDRPFRPGGNGPARSGEGRPFRPQGDRPSRPGGDRSAGRPSFGGGGGSRFGGRPGGGAGDRRKGPGSFPARPDRPSRPPRKSRPEDEA